MKIMLTSSLGGASKIGGVRVPSVLIRRNGLLDNLRKIWTPDARVLIICADPDDYKKNDDVCSCLEKSFPMSGLSISVIEICDVEIPKRSMPWKALTCLFCQADTCPRKTDL